MAIKEMLPKCTEIPWSCMGRTKSHMATFSKSLHSGNAMTFKKPAAFLKEQEKTIPEIDMESE